jgi:O-antigen ligase
MSANVFRVSGLLGHPNFLSGTLAMLLPIIAAVLLSGASRMQKLVAASAFLLGCVALLLTLSRSGWLAFALACLILLGMSFVHPRLRKRYVGPRLALLGIGILAALVFAPSIIKRFTMSDPGALQFRYEWMTVAWNMVKGDPLLGLGLNTFVFNLPGNTPYGGPTGLNERFGPIWPVVHNIYLLVWSEQGTLGFLLFLGFHVALIRTAVRNLRSYVDETPYIINIGCLAGLAAIMFDGIGSFYIRSPPGGRLFFMLAALIYAVHYWNMANRLDRVAMKRTGFRSVPRT